MNSRTASALDWVFMLRVEVVKSQEKIKGNRSDVKCQRCSGRHLESNEQGLAFCQPIGIEHSRRNDLDEHTIFIRMLILDF